jgi:hypothetical protein
MVMCLCEVLREELLSPSREATESLPITNDAEVTHLEQKGEKNSLSPVAPHFLRGTTGPFYADINLFSRSAETIAGALAACGWKCSKYYGHCGVFRQVESLHLRLLWQ